MSYNGCSSIDKAGKILCIHSYTNLNRSRRHLYRDDSCDYSIRYVYSYLENFRYPSTSHRPSICCHCRRRTEQFLEHCQRQGTQVDDKPLERPSRPRSRHKQFPMSHCEIFLLFLLCSTFHQQVLIFLHVNQLQITCLKGLPSVLGIFPLRNPWFIKDVPSVQGGGIQLWAPRFTDSFLLGIINKFCVICFGNGKKCISQK